MASIIKRFTPQQWATLFQVFSILVLAVAVLCYVFSFPEVRKFPATAGFVVAAATWAIVGTYIARLVRRRW